TTEADLFGFQGLDGNWIPGPLTTDLLIPYQEPTTTEVGEPEESEPEKGEEPDEPAGAAEEDDDRMIPRLVFLDEANRVDIEALLSPIQAALDQMQKRKEPPVIALGRTQYVAPRRIWRIFAGNSPAADIGRREQSRPLKRRMTTVIPPDPMVAAL